jgi:murein DD-endopeptidase MepM/ murein hydrolase activator NlpD
MRGVVTQGFGRQPHPTLSGITIDNNGVDITTEAGNGVLSIFQGTVSSVFNLPGAGTSVIVTHGAYRTVYSNVAQCALKKGDAVEVGQRLGVVAGAPGSNAILHFEVWKVAGSERTPQDPRTWLKAK